MQTFSKETINNNDFYVDTINYIFFSPEIFLTSSYIKDVNTNMEHRIIQDDLDINEILSIRFIIGLCKYKLKDYFYAINIFEDLVNNEYLKHNPFIMCNLYTTLTLSYLKINNIDRHIKYFNLSVEALKNHDLNQLLLYLYLNTSLDKLNIYKFDELLGTNIHKSFNILTNYDGVYYSQAFIILATIYYKHLNLPSIAIDLLNKALPISKAKNEKNIQVLIRYNIACAYLSMGNINDGVNILKEILNNTATNLPSILKLNIYSKLLNVSYKSTDIFNESQQFLTLYKNELYKLDSYYIDIFLAIFNLYVVHYKIIEYKSSFNESTLNELFYYLDNSLYIYKSNFSKFTFMEFEYWLEVSYGNLYYSLGNYESSLLHHKKALLYSEKFQNANNVELYKLISLDYEKLSNYKEALKYLKASSKAQNNYNNLQDYNFFINIFEEFNNKLVINSFDTSFFSNLSHELKTPVNIIYSSIQLMGALKDKESNSLKEYFIKYEKSVKQNCLRMLKLINNLIDITKIDSGTAKLDLTFIDIVPFIEDLTLSIIPYVKYKNLNVTFDTNIEKLYLNIDIYAFERILLNLISNAIKFNNNNGSILVSIYSTKENVNISVKDTGIGIPNNLKDSIFNRFYKVDDSFSRKTEGSGIGLSITKSLVELHGGIIKLNNEYKNGSEFIITLPNIPAKNTLIKNKFKYFIDDEKILRELSDIYELF